MGEVIPQAAKMAGKKEGTKGTLLKSACMKVKFVKASSGTLLLDMSIPIYVCTKQGRVRSRHSLCNFNALFRALNHVNSPRGATSLDIQDTISLQCVLLG